MFSWSRFKRNRVGFCSKVLRRVITQSCCQGWLYVSKPGIQKLYVLQVSAKTMTSQCLKQPKKSSLDNLSPKKEFLDNPLLGCLLEMSYNFIIAAPVCKERITFTPVLTLILIYHTSLIHYHLTSFFQRALNCFNVKLRPRKRFSRAKKASKSCVVSAQGCSSQPRVPFSLLRNSVLSM